MKPNQKIDFNIGDLVKYAYMPLYGIVISKQRMNCFCQVCWFCVPKSLTNAGFATMTITDHPQRDIGTNLLPLEEASR